MNRENVLKILDYVSYIFVLAATALIIAFEFTGNLTVFKVGLYMYEVCFFVLLVFTVLRLVFVFKKEEHKDEIFIVSTKKKVLLVVKLVLVLIGFCLSSVMIGLM